MPARPEGSPLGGKAGIQATAVQMATLVLDSGLRRNDDLKQRIVVSNGRTGISYL